MKTVFTAIVASLLLLGCVKDDDVNSQPPENFQEIALEFSLTFEGAPFEFSPEFYTLYGGERMRFTRIKWLLSGIRLETDEDTVYADVPYAFFHPQGQRLVSTVKFPKSVTSASRIAFEVGVDEAANHGDPNLLPPTHPLHPMVNQLHWGWAEGYVFALLEGFEDTPGGQEPVVYHIGFVENIQSRSFDLTTNELPKKLSFALAVDKIFDGEIPFLMSERGRFTHSVNDGGLARDLSVNFSNAIKIQ
jgi:hypothetical protein